jgi:hypothetical protein
VNATADICEKDAADLSKTDPMAIQEKKERKASEDEDAIINKIDDGRLKNNTE